MAVFIKILRKRPTPDGQSVSSLEIPDNGKGPALVIGVLPHNTEIRPRTAHDARRLAAWAIAEAHRLDTLDELRARFPWLGTDAEAAGADTVDALAKYYRNLDAELSP